MIGHVTEVRPFSLTNTRIQHQNAGDIDILGQQR